MLSDRTIKIIQRNSKHLTDLSCCKVTPIIELLKFLLLFWSKSWFSSSPFWFSFTFGYVGIEGWRRNAKLFTNLISCQFTAIIIPLHFIKLHLSKCYSLFSCCSRSRLFCTRRRKSWAQNAFAALHFSSR